MYRLITNLDHKIKRPTNPRSKANILEVLTFSWLFQVFKTGRKRDLDENDLYAVLDEHKSSLLGNEFEKKWKIELVNAKLMNRSPSLLRVLRQMFGKKLILQGLVRFLVEIVLKLSQPLLIGRLLMYFNPGGSNDTELINACFYAVCLLLNILISVILHHHSLIEIYHCGLMMQVACCSVIFTKALCLKKTGLGKTNIGQGVNLLSNDVKRFSTATTSVHGIWICPLQSIIIAYFLWQEIGVSSLFGVGVLLVFMPLQGWLGKKTLKLRSNTAARTDERIRLINELISGIQVIKMYTWEKPFTYLIQCARKSEIRQIKKSTFIKAVAQCFVVFPTRFALFVSIFSYILLGNYISVNKVFVTITYYAMLEATMTLKLPDNFATLAEMMASIKRVQNFLLLDEKDETLATTLDLQSKETIAGTKMSDVHTNDQNCSTDHIENLRYTKGLNISAGIVISNATAKWTKDQSENAINDINLTVEPGQLLVIIGAVGAGKSSLLQAILQELPLSKGSISVFGKVSYASQEPWIFSGSVQDNILFGSPMDKTRYDKVIEVCALITDLEQLPHGDETIVGERGVLLSGGQRARINLARAIFKRADIYLLDDPLSAVDTHVGVYLFENCIKKYLKGKICILITHQIQYLSSSNEHVVLMENANIVTRGSYQELQSSLGLDSKLDCTKLLESADEEVIKSKIASHGDVSATHSLDPSPISSRRHSSYQRVLWTVDKNQFTGASNVKSAATRSSGNVPRSVYFSYLTAGGNVYSITFLLLTCGFVQILSSLGDYWVSYWVNLEVYVFCDSIVTLYCNSTTQLSTTTIIVNNHSYETLLWWSISRKTCIVVYVVLTLSLVVVVFVKCSLFIAFFMNASTHLHNNMLSAIVKATMQFFNTNSSGRLLNHFTDDMGTIDDILPKLLMQLINIILNVIGVIFIISMSNVYFAIVTFVVGSLCYNIVVVYSSFSRSIRRIDGESRSPVYAHFKSCLQGLTTIRAFKAEAILTKEFNDYQDLNSSAWYLFISSNEAFGCLLDVMCLIYISLLIFGLIFIYNDSFGGNVGLIITQSLRLTSVVQFGIRLIVSFDNRMTSVERILKYNNVPQETAQSSVTDIKPPKKWPTKGLIEFQNVSLRYSPDTPYVLRNINVTIQSCEKIGIVGRTGAGKSSLIGALFRLALNEGVIIIDDLEIHKLGLHDLRSKISIIPQEPILFSGTIRTNLDPLEEYSDHVLCKALEKVELKDVVDRLSSGLNSKVFDGGFNFSFGQRQLMCLARAILRENKILVLDEATANVDAQTDALIQNTIKNKFRSCTVLTIAHRLNTVMDADKILVMDDGLLVEFDHPNNLLKNNNGYFYKLVEQMRQVNNNVFHTVAEEALMRV